MSIQYNVLGFEPTAFRLEPLPLDQGSRPTTFIVNVKFSFNEIFWTSDTASSALLLTSTIISIVRRVRGSSKLPDPQLANPLVKPDPKFPAELIWLTLTEFLCWRMVKALFVLSTIPRMQFSIWKQKYFVTEPELIL